MAEQAGRGERIYTLSTGGELEPMTEQRFDTEAALQRLIAQHPELLAGEQINPHDPPRWILVRREKGIADSPDAALARWAVDHLLIDQHAVPTLVEVKRGDNRELRRTVVGQMLEYAAHASRTWTTEELRNLVERQTEEQETGASELLAELLDEEEPDEDAFWDDVATHLAAKRLRLLFVADEIPDELARVVEFLNEQMPNIEVLAVEIKQFRGESGQILVPRVIGALAAGPKPTAGRGRVNLTRESFLDAFADERARSAAARLLQVADSHGATVAPGVKGVSIRVSCSLWPSRQPLTLAWLYVNPDVEHWFVTRDFSFGTAAGQYTRYELDEQLRTRIDAWESAFADEPFAEPIEGRGIVGCAIKHADAAANIESIASRLGAVIDDLRGL